MRTRRGLKFLVFLLAAGIFSGCAAGGNTGKKATSSTGISSSEENRYSNVSQVEKTDGSEDQGTPETKEVADSADLWDGFSKGVTGSDDYSFQNSTNTYRNDAEDRWGYVYQTVSGKKEENIITLKKKDAEIMEVVYVTDEALYYQCKYEWDVKREKYKRRELWRVPIKKTDGHDELLFEQEKCIIKNLDIQDIHVMDSLIYVTFNKDRSSERKAFRQTGRSDFGIYDLESEKWLDLGEVPEEIDQMTYRYWCGVTEEGGFLETVQFTSKGEEDHVNNSLYFIDHMTHQWKNIVQGGADKRLSVSYDSKALFIADGHQVQVYQGGGLKEFLTEQAVDEKVHEIWNRWTKESAAWDYGENQWYLDEIMLSNTGRLQLIFNITDSKKTLTDHDWCYKANSRDGFFSSRAIVLECPLVFEASTQLSEPEDQDGFLHDTLAQFDNVLYDRVDWQTFEAGFKEKEKEEFSAFLPVLTKEAEFTLLEWDGKKKKIADCRRTVTTMKQLMEKEKLENYLYQASMQEFFQTGTADLLLELWNNYILIIHKENGRFYGFHASGESLEDRDISRKGIFFICAENSGKNLYYRVTYPEKKSDGDLILQAVFEKVGEESMTETNYFIHGKKVSEKKFEKWWDEPVAWQMPKWKK